MADFFTSDEHHDHGNIIEYVHRPFKNKNEMMKVIIERYNDTVSENDVVYHLGDISMVGSSRIHFFESLTKKYRKVKSRHLILGNHDDLKPFAYVNIGLFTTVHTAFWTQISGQRVVMAHDPAIYQPAIWDSVMLCGHVHKLFKTIPDQKLVNVGVDVWDFRPVRFEELMDYLNSQAGTYA